MTITDRYLTVAARAQSEYKVERSRFISSAIPVASKEEAERVYGQIRKEYHDATHNCFAYRVGFDPHLEFRCSDDGEPSGTAGRPIYDSIVYFELTNCLVVVTRYFGGVKLGTGGLSRAYRDAARKVLQESQIVERFLEQEFILRFGHEQISAVMKIVSEFEVTAIETNYEDGVEIKGRIRVGRFDLFRNLLVQRLSGRIMIE